MQSSRNTLRSRSLFQRCPLYPFGVLLAIAFGLGISWTFTDTAQASQDDAQQASAALQQRAEDLTNGAGFLDLGFADV
jgi:hypothetical protein